MEDEGPSRGLFSDHTGLDSFQLLFFWIWFLLLSSSCRLTYYRGWTFRTPPVAHKVEQHPHRETGALIANSNQSARVHITSWKKQTTASEAAAASHAFFRLTGKRATPRSEPHTGDSLSIYNKINNELMYIFKKAKLKPLYYYFNRNITWINLTMLWW